MGRLEDRLRKLEGMFIHEPTAQEYLDASNRERARALQKVAVLLVPYSFDGDYLFPEGTLRMLSTDTPERRERDRQTIEVWYKAQGRNRAAETETAKEKLLAKLETRSKK